MRLQLRDGGSARKICCIRHRIPGDLRDCILEDHKLTHTTRRLLQSEDDLPTQLPALPTKDEIRDTHFPPKRSVTHGRHLSRKSNKAIVYANGDVCISILHPPEDDQYGYEKASERWSPVLSPETVIISVISMLGSPNDESAANIEAGKLWREDQKEFKRKVRRCVRDSMESAWE